MIIVHINYFKTYCECSGFLQSQVIAPSKSFLVENQFNNPTLVHSKSLFLKKNNN